MSYGYKKGYNPQKYAENRKAEKERTYQMIDDTASEVSKSPDKLREFLDVQAKFDMYSAEDASKIDRIIERFKLGTVDKGSITNELEKSVSEKTSKSNEEKTNGDLILEHIEAKSTEETDKNPSLSRTEKDSLSESSSKAINDKAAKDKKQSVKEMLDGYKDEIKADRAKDIADKSKTVADTIVKSAKSVKER